ncbi:selenocysteine lyase [Scomber japonicus]|uniref:selenocysteine lyase n=1 Tax=Scomber japonicus TaxID=13676 RepID=UPI002305F41D|nr:selenocysteine lyase [Scomber japonicus]XP_053178535.1 selenocysteine lyase [Scomber japonicus]XP_053178536.1 selenocysteine lyase [Scomber japonicus]XP_053178537.1 selenocysteine lyase [Scomber japonicus]XP_053178538.1 selenocysteine lyase [Scomber japonicus]XP_053178539.1 selenocysteine lyase [Scomber japonicus]
MANQYDDVALIKGHTFTGHTLHHSDMDLDRIYMDYNATTPLEPEVIQAITEALQDAWGNPSSNYIAGVKAKTIITQSRENVARMVGGKAEDIIFSSGGTEANNLVLHTAVEHFRRNCRAAEQDDGRQNGSNGLPHIITSNVEHDSVKLAAEHLQRDGKADVTYVPVSKVTARVEVEDIIAAVRPNTCLISIMLANNETGVIMPVQEICQRIKCLNKQHHRLRILLHTDAAQALGKIRVDACELGVDYLTIVGHKFYAPRIGALYVNSPGTKTPLYPMLFGGGQERNFRPGTENTPMIAGLGKAAELVTTNLLHYESHMRSIRLYLEERLQAVFKDRIHFNSRYPGSDNLPNTCNVSILGPTLQGWRVLSNCNRLLASVGAACHSDSGNRPSHILLNCGVPTEVAANALRLSVGRGTSKADVDAAVEDLRDTVRLLEKTD